MQALEGVMAGVRVRVWRRALGAWLPALGLGLLLAAGAALGAEKAATSMAPLRMAAPDMDDDGNVRVIVKYRPGSNLAQNRQGAQRLGQQLRLALSDGHALGERSQSLRARGIGAQDLAARLAAQSDVEWAVPVQRKTVRGVVPNDPLFADGQTPATPAVGQWYLRAPNATLVSAVNALGAWAITEGSASITVAVLDTGVRYDHPDLAGKLWPGYDFVSSNSAANDGGGRDADATDPGDWSTASDSCGPASSSWHGTQVAGLVGAATNNGIGIAGTGRNTMVLPVRVLGRCGGWDDDIQAGMRWAGGLSNAAGCTGSSAVSATCNPHPARVLNLSLGASGACNQGYRAVIAELNAAGVVVVVAAGNDGGHAVNTPANCSGALAVAGVRQTGTKVGYSNLGPQVAVAAPGGNCSNATGPCLYSLVTTLNAGATTPGASSYSSGSEPTLGTSFSAPIVAGTIGLMLAVDPSLTPANVKSVLQATARAFPTTGAQEPGILACRAPDGTDQLECYCTTSTCGAGLLDAAAAVAAVDAAKSAPTAVLAASSTTPDAGTMVTLDGRDSRAISGRSIAGYQWAIVSGLASLIGATNGSRVSLSTRAAGKVVVRLTVTDSAGASRSSTATITVVDATRAVIGASTTVPTVGQVVKLDGSTGSRAVSGRTIASYQWAIASGAASASLSVDTDQRSARLSTLAVGAVVVQLTVTDSAGTSRSATLTVNAVAPPVAVITASNARPTAGTAITLSGADSSAGSGRTIARHQWSITSGSAIAKFIGATNSSSASLDTSAAGNVVVRLTVTDSAGASHRSTLTVNVVAPPVAVITASNAYPTAGTQIILGGAGSSAGSGRTIARHQWSITSGSAIAKFIGATNSSSASLRTSAAGTVVVQLTVTDSAGASRSTTLTVEVVALPVAVIAASTTKPAAGTAVTLSGTGSTAGSGRTIASHQWSITSGSGLASFSGATNGSSARLTTSAAGTVVVRLLVTDNAGASRSTTKSITIR